MADVLIVEDEYLVAEDIARVTQSCGHEVVGISHSGEDAIEAAQATHPDLAIMDIKLKGSMNGIAAAKRLREMLGIPAVFLSAYCDDSTLSAARYAKPLGFLVKPFRDDDLRAALALYLPPSAQGEHTDSLPTKKPSSPRATAAPSINILEFLQSISLGVILSNEELRELADGASIRTFKDGENITTPSDPGCWPFLVYSGRVEVVSPQSLSQSGQGQGFVTALIPPRDPFGLLWMQPQQSMLHLRANRPSTIVFLAPHKLERLLDGNPEINSLLTEVASQRFRCIAAIAGSMVGNRAAHRVVQTLLALIPRFSYRGHSKNGCVLDVSRTELARLSGLALETVVRALAELEQHKLVSLHRRKSVEILDIVGLTQQIGGQEESLFY